MPSSVTNGRAGAVRYVEAQSKRDSRAGLISMRTSRFRRPCWGWLLFRAQSPNSKDVLTSDREQKMMNGVNAEGGLQTGRAPIVTKSDNQS
ncbi:hypothetical protein N7468_010078 [Penicillium chermesinum]|uniref:Uncharacterized protein n=1 Tax=Penicillium chermesinum TaxID=63820 RepID=A0A9W9TD04_9EURO|nr:uncharacterized protein N7468_010078 [Penicillium chermesinum]KAJ5217070.1 hypothetical protein N7468_010078 [Penicillium chermesinum]KAJ6171314.1 hypothetical protein N7470_000381 [Penicillium chermesinum]